MKIGQKNNWIYTKVYLIETQNQLLDNRKKHLEDLKKSLWYLQDEIGQIEKHKVELTIKMKSLILWI